MTMYRVDRWGWVCHTYTYASSLYSPPLLYDPTAFHPCTKICGSISMDCVAESIRILCYTSTMEVAVMIIQLASRQCSISDISVLLKLALELHLNHTLPSTLICSWVKR